ncbi:MAG: inositol monophosphatase family protein [Candidatus Thorarchaeota archaeon]|jgi:histidinol phosphatase-like enzyme (inositol monophosphatase family)
MQSERLEEYLAFIVDVASEAGKITMEYFLKDIEFDIKSDDTPVTIADRLTEEYIRKRIEEEYPSHSILGEEAGETKGDSSFRWIIDPIDGTQSFIRGVPQYTVLIALEHEGVPEVGVIHNPPLKETVSAAIGIGAFYNGKSCHVSSTSRLEDAWVQVTDFADLSRRRLEFTQRLLSKAYSCRTWGDAYGYLLVATGRVDVMIDPIMNIWDIAPLQPIITESGGVFTDLDGKQNALGTSSLACNLSLHEEIMSIMK